MKRLCLTAALLAVASTAFATPPHHAPHKPTPKPVAVATSSSTSSSKSQASADADVSNTNTVAPTISPTIAPTNTVANDNRSNANNEGVDQALSITNPRNAPGLGQGSLYIPECGAAGNAGGSNTHGAAFLGFAWTPRDCKLLQTAAAYAALGMKNTACEMVNGTSAAKARFKELGIHPPICDLEIPALLEQSKPAAADLIPQVPIEPQELQMTVVLDRSACDAQPGESAKPLDAKPAKRPGKPRKVAVSNCSKP